MLEKLKANFMFEQLLKRKDIRKAYKMVGPKDKQTEMYQGAIQEFVDQYMK